VYAKNGDLNDLSLINLDVDHDTLSHEKMLVSVATHGHLTSQTTNVPLSSLNLDFSLPILKKVKHHLKGKAYSNISIQSQIS
jgi:hypothetical protein